MTESRFPEPPPTAAPAAPPPGREERNARVETLPVRLQALSRPVRVEGEIIRADPETGSVRVRTDEGDIIDLRLRGGPEQTPREGSRVQVDLPAGKPPRTAALSAAPPAPPPGSAATPPQTPPVRDREPPQQDRPAATPPGGNASRSPAPSGPEPESGLKNPELREQETTARAAPIPPPRPTLPAGFTLNIPPPSLSAVPAATPSPQETPPTALPPGSIIRLIPLPPEQAALVGQQAPPAAVSTSLPPAAAFRPAALFPVLPPEESAPPLLPAVLHAPVVESVFQNLLPDAHTPPSPLFAFLFARAADSFLPLATHSAPAVKTSPEIIQSIQFAPDKQVPALPAITAEKAGTPGHPALLFSPQAEADANTAPATGRQVTNAPAALQSFDIKIAAAAPPPLSITAPKELPGKQTLLPAGFPATSFPPSSVPTSIPAPSILTLLHPRAFAVHMTGHIAGEISPPPDTPAATVTTTAVKNRAVLSVPSPVPGPPRLFTMPVPAETLPPGTEILFTPLQEFRATELPPATPRAAPGAAILPPAGSAYYDFLPGTPWPALEELAQALAQAAPQDGRAALIRATPGPANPQHLPAAALLFIAAARAGDIGGWLGDRVMDTLRRAGKGEVLERASRSFGSLARLSSETAGQDWRALSLPLYWQDGIHKMMLYYRDGGRGGEEDGEDGAPKSTRFLFDLHVPRLGDVQIDGFHAGRRLDLILRTKTMLSPPMQQAMRRRYADAIETAGLKGEMSFQGQAARFVKIGLPGTATDATL